MNNNNNDNNTNNNPSVINKGKQLLSPNKLVTATMFLTLINLVSQSLIN